MDVSRKLSVLAVGAKFDRSGGEERGGLAADEVVDASAGRRLFKVLQTNECVHDCAFCPWRSRRETERATLGPDAMAGAFHAAHAAGRVDGLYLSSAVRESGRASMDSMLATAEIVRTTYAFEGYLHLKILPGAEREQIREAMRLANGVSLNLDAPTETRFAALTTTRLYGEDLDERLGWIRDLSAEFPVDEGVSTQFVVGVGETDRELLARTHEVRRDYDVRKAFFSSFRPMVGTPLEALAPSPAARERRLRQAQILLGAYGIGFEELGFGPSGNLSLSIDPKMAGALLNPGRFPVEVNVASYEELIRVPGIGLLSAKRLVSRRRDRPIRDAREIALCGAVLKKAAPFLLLNGRPLGNLEQFIRQELRRFQTRPALQLSLFDL